MSVFLWKNISFPFYNFTKKNFQFSIPIFSSPMLDSRLVRWNRWKKQLFISKNVNGGLSEKYKLLTYFETLKCLFFTHQILLSPFTILLNRFLILEIQLWQRCCRITEPSLPVSSFRSQMPQHSSPKR